MMCSHDMFVHAHANAPSPFLSPIPLMKIEEDPREDLELKEDLLNKEDLSPPQTKGSSARYLENLSQENTDATSTPQTKRGSNLRSLVKDLKPKRKGGPRNNYLDSL